eukprot:scaffold14756_cov63-Attheya_sp.AAC.3
MYRGCRALLKIQRLWTGKWINASERKVQLGSPSNNTPILGNEMLAHLYSESPEPESHGIWDGRIEGFRSQHKHRLAERTNAIANRLRTKPHTLLYVHFHLVARRDASRFLAASHSTPIIPSTENTRGVKCLR